MSTTTTTTAGLAEVVNACKAYDEAVGTANEERGAFADTVYAFEIDERLAEGIKYDDIVTALDSPSIKSDSTYRDVIALGMTRQVCDDAGLPADSWPKSFVAGRILKSGLKNAEGKAFKLTNADAYAELISHPEYEARVRIFAEIMETGDVTDEREAANMATEDPNAEPKPEKTEAEKAEAKLTTFLNALDKIEDDAEAIELIALARKELTAAAKARKS